VPQRAVSASLAARPAHFICKFSAREACGQKAKVLVCNFCVICICIVRRCSQQIIRTAIMVKPGLTKSFRKTFHLVTDNMLASTREHVIKHPTSVRTKHRNINYKSSEHLLQRIGNEVTKLLITLFLST